MATNIPPHNLREVVDGCIHMIDHPDCTTEDLMQFIKGPDFPTGGIIPVSYTHLLVAVRTLEALHEIALTMENPQSLIRAVDLFVAGERHFGTLMLDSVMSAIAMNRLYFRFRLLDEAFEGCLLYTSQQRSCCTRQSLRAE